MMRFAGRSLETHHMKNKPIGEGYKFFCLATKEGYIINFTPNGRTAAKSQTQEYKADKKFGKIESMIIHVLSVIKKLNKNRKKEHQRQQDPTAINVDNNQQILLLLWTTTLPYHALLQSCVI